MMTKAGWKKWRTEIITYYIETYDIEHEWFGDYQCRITIPGGKKVDLYMPSGKMSEVGSNVYKNIDIEVYLKGLYEPKK